MGIFLKDYGNLAKLASFFFLVFFFFFNKLTSSLLQGVNKAISLGGFCT